MPIAHVWPQADPLASEGPESEPLFETPDSTVVMLPDPLALVASLAPELSRLFGYRIGLRPLVSGSETEAGLAAAGLAEVGRLTVPASTGQGAGMFLLAVDRASLSRLLDRMFGARPDPGAPADTLAGLPPQSGSWLSLARLMGQALARALQANGTAPLAARAFAPPSRVAPAAEQAADGLNPGDRLLFRLDSGGADGLLLLRRVRSTVRVAVPLAPEPLLADIASSRSRPPMPDAGDGAASRNWGRRARDFALDLELPVSVVVGEIPLALEDIADLQPGDVLPLSRPRGVSVLVSGQHLAHVPAAAFEAGRRATDAPVSAREQA